jgi:hypothetical protein
MLVVSLMLIARTGSNSGFTQDDDPGRTSVDAKGATGTYVFINDKDNVVVRILAGLVRIDCLFDRVGREHMNALPRTDVDAAFAHDAFGLIDVQKLLWFNRLVELIR